MNTNTANRNRLALATLLVALALTLTATIVAVTPNTAHAAKLGPETWQIIGKESGYWNREAAFIGDDCYTIDLGIKNGKQVRKRTIQKNYENFLTLSKHKDHDAVLTNGEYLVHLNDLDSNKKDAIDVYLYNLSTKKGQKLFSLKAWNLDGAWIYNDTLYYSISNFGGMTGPTKIWKVPLKKGAKAKLMTSKYCLSYAGWGLGKYALVHTKYEFGKYYLMNVTTKKCVRVYFHDHSWQTGWSDKYWYYATEKKINSSYKYITWYRVNPNGKDKKTLGRVKAKKNQEIMYVSGWEGVYGTYEGTVYHYNFATGKTKAEKDGRWNAYKRVSDVDPEAAAEEEAVAEAAEQAAQAAGEGQQ